MPEKPSEPPHCSASFSAEAGIGSRVARFTSGRSSVTWATIAATVFVVPPVSWMVRPWKRSEPSPSNIAFMRATCITSQPSPTKIAAPTFGMGRMAPEHALEIGVARRVRRHRAAGAVAEGHRAVDVGIGVEEAAGVHLVGGAADHCGRAVHCRADRDVVAGAGLPAGAAVAHEGRRLHDRDSGPGGVEGCADLVGLVVVAEGAVVGVHMGTLGDVLGGIADDLAEFQDRRARGERRAGNLVAGAERPPAGLAAASEHRDAVAGMQHEKGRGLGHGRGLPS